MVFISKCSSALFLPASPIFLANSLFFNNLMMTLVKASGFFGGINKPVTPSSMASGVPPTLVATTGLAMAMASKGTKENASPKFVHSVNMSVSKRIESRRSFCTKPVNVTYSLICNSVAIFPTFLNMGHPQRESDERG